MSNLIPDLNALVNAARALAPEHVQQLTDFAEFLGTKYAVPVAASAEMETVSDADDEVDLGGSPSSSDVTTHNWADLSGVFRDDFGGHSAIGLV